MIGLAIAGLLLGLIGAPLVLYVIAFVVIQGKEKTHKKEARAIMQKHNQEIRSLKKQYEKDKQRFHKLDLKIQRVIARAKESEAK